MNQVSRPMQIALGAVLVFAVLWFVALRPKEAAVEPVAATPATPAQTPAADAGGAEAQTGIGKTVEAAKNGAAAADAAVQAREAQTGDATTSATPAGTPAQTAGSTPAAAGTPAGKPAAKKQSKVSAAQRRADREISAIKRHLEARRAVVVLVWSPSGNEDKVLQRRIKNEIKRRGGKVRTYFINVSDVGRYDGLLSGLALSQTPSTIVIAPNNEAKVLGGLTSTERIDRLTSAALQVKATATTK